MALPRSKVLSGRRDTTDLLQPVLAAYRVRLRCLQGRQPLRQHFYLYLLSDILAQAVAQSSIAFWFAETFGGFGESGSAEWPRGWTTPVIQVGSSAWSSFRGCDCGSGVQWRQPSAVRQFEGHRTPGKQRFCNSFSLRATRPMRWKGIFPTGSRQPPPAPQTTTTLYHNCQGRGAIRENPKHSLRNGCGSKGVRLTTTMVAVASTLFVEKLQLRHNMVELCANWHAFSKWAPHTTASGAGVNPSKGSGVQCFSSVYNCSCSVTQTGHLPSSGTLGREVALWCPRCLPCPCARKCLQMSVSVGVSADMCAVSTCLPVARMWLQISVDVWIFMLRCSKTLLGVVVVENIHMPCESCAHSAAVRMGRGGEWHGCVRMSVHVRVCQQMPKSKENRCNRITPGAVLSAV